MGVIQITAATREAALREAVDRYGLPAEALEIEWTQEDEDLLAGAKPLVQMNASIKASYVAEKVEACLKALLEKMTIEATLETHFEGEIILLSIESPDPDILIGHRGETLDAIQQLVLRMTRLSGREIPLVLLDVGSYRARRIQRLKRVCQDLATSVVETGKEEFFDPMDAIDRRIVHTLLKEYEGIKTYSRGEDLSRHVIVAPAD